MDVDCITAGAETFTANVYLVRGTAATLVDAGAMVGVSAAVSDRIGDLEALLITHGHDDHVSQLAELQAAFDPIVAAGAPPPGASALSDGDTVSIGGHPFEVLETPGHAPDHLVFIGEETIFTGDLVVYADEAFEDGSFGRTDLPGGDREVLLESIDRVLSALPGTVESMYPGHGPAFHGDVRTVIERARDRAARGEPKYPG